MDGPEKRARMVVEEFERWKESVGKRCQDIFPQARGPMVALLVQFVSSIDRNKNGNGEKTLKQLRILSDAAEGSVDEGDFERFFRDFMMEFLTAMRMDMQFVNQIAKEAFRRLDEWPGGML